MDFKNQNVERILLIPMTFLLVFAVSCTRETNESSSLTIKLPTNLSSKTSEKAVVAQNDDVPEWNGDLNPTSLSAISCYGIFVGGANPEMRRNSCSSSVLGGSNVFRFGRSKGFLPANSEVEINDIPPGDINVWIVGIVSQDGTCSEFDKINDAFFSKNSYPHIIAETQLRAVAGDNSVEMVAELDPSRVFDKCDFIEDGGPGGGDDDDDGGGGGNIGNLFGDGLDGSFEFDGATVDLDTTTFSDSDITRTGGTRGGSTKIFSANHKIVSLSPDRRGVQVTSAVSSNQYEVGDEVFWHVTGGYSFSSGPDVQPADTSPGELMKGACGGGLFMGSYGFAKIQGIAGNNIVVDEPVGDPTIPLSDHDGDGIPPFNISMPANAGSLPIDDTQNFCVVQIRRVPQFDELILSGGGTTEFYSNASVNFDYANGFGGIIVVKARKVILDGSDFRLEAGYSGFKAYVDAAGQGYLGRFSDNSYSPSNGNGGGGTFSGGGAGGGSNSGAGGSGAGSSSGPSPITNCSGPCQTMRDRKFFLGGAGGGIAGGPGARGGGAVLLFAGEIDTASQSPDGSNLILDAKGGDGTGARGGGAGGAASLTTSNLQNVILTGDVTGGNGGLSSGGGGGGGSLEVVLCSSQFNPATNNINSSSISGGTNGTGGQPGGPGDLILTNDDANLCDAIP